MRLGVVLSSNEKMLNLGVLHLSTMLMLRSQVHSSNDGRRRNQQRKRKFFFAMGEDVGFYLLGAFLSFNFLAFLVIVVGWVGERR